MCQQPTPDWQAMQRAENIVDSRVRGVDLSKEENIKGLCQAIASAITWTFEEHITVNTEPLYHEDTKLSETLTGMTTQLKRIADALGKG